MTLQEAKSLHQGQRICCYAEDHRRRNRNPSGMRWLWATVTSVKIWKTKPDKVLVGMKYGMYDYFKLDAGCIDEWQLSPTHDKGDEA